MEQCQQNIMSTHFSMMMYTSQKHHQPKQKNPPTALFAVIVSESFKKESL